MRVHIVRLFIALSVCLAAAAPAFAQPTYVAASFIGELSRFASIDVDDNSPGRVTSVDDLSRNGKSIGFDLRVGRGLAGHWGVELAFARGGTVDNVQSQALTPSGIDPIRGVLPIVPIPEIQFERRVSTQHTTVDALAWFNQDLNDRVGLTFLGGVSFSRASTEQSLRISDNRLAIYLPYPAEIETVQYGAGPAVGAEVTIDIGSHAAVSSGVRLHAVDAGWLIRPGVGLRWTF